MGGQKKFLLALLAECVPHFENRGATLEVVASRCQILRLKCTKFDFGCGSAPDPADGAYSAPPGPRRGLLVGEGREGKGAGRKGIEWREEKVKGGEGKEWEVPRLF